MLAQEIVKIKITQHYHFNNHFHHDTFIIDFENGNAYWDSNYFLEAMLWQGDIEKYGLQDVNPMNHELYKILDSRVTKDEFELNDVDKFLRGLEKIDIFDQIDSFESSGSLLGHVEFLNVVHITLYSANSEEKYIVDWQFPDSWLDFAKLLENLVGFDILNIENSKYFVSEFDYTILDDWIVDNEEFNELALDKIRFNYDNGVVGCTINDWIIDVSNKTLTLNTYSHHKAPQDLSDDVLVKLTKLLRKYHVFSWSSKESWRNLPEETWVINGGYSWCLEFEFTNGAIYNVGANNVHPEEYLDFANEIEKLFDKKLLRSQDCNDWSILKCLTPHPISKNFKHKFYIVYYNNERIGFCYDEEIERYNDFFQYRGILFQEVSVDTILEELSSVKNNNTNP